VYKGGKMTKEIEQNQVNRRGFMKAAIVTAAAAASSGAAAGFLLKERSKTTETLQISSLAKAPDTVSSSAVKQSELQAQLAALRAENSRLNIRLSASQSELDLARRMSENKPQYNDDAWRRQLEEANSTASNLGEEVELLRGLVTLYEQMDEVNIPAIVGSGLATVGGVMDGLMSDVPLVREGLEAGQQALTEFEEQLPDLEDGRHWLAGRIALLSNAYDTVELALKNALEATDSFIQLLNQWFQDMLRWLPFGLGDKALNVMEALSNLLADIPETLDGFENKVNAPLDLWLADDEGQPRLQRRLIKPVRENALDKASTTVDQVETLQLLFQANLTEPVATATQQRELIAQQISQYRQQHQL
jgi:hypothetical protein